MSEIQQPEMPADRPTCFVIMPISDAEGYEAGHFRRVYDHLIVPACDKAGYKPRRADDTKAADFILLGILRSILASEMCVCDLSTRNPNVMFELGMRQAFNKPVALMRDLTTPRIFDVQGLRDVEYDPSLRVDFIKAKVDELADAIKQTARLQAGDGNSLVELLNIASASPPPKSKISSDTALILNELGALRDRLRDLERQNRPTPKYLDLARTQLKSIDELNRLQLAENDFNDAIERGKLLSDRAHTDKQEPSKK